LRSCGKFDFETFGSNFSLFHGPGLIWKQARIKRRGGGRSEDCSLDYQWWSLSPEVPPGLPRRQWSEQCLIHL
jgi:hypothetical protein